jgi:hypothetical protein
MKVAAPPLNNDSRGVVLLWLNVIFVAPGKRLIYTSLMMFSLGGKSSETFLHRTEVCVSKRRLRVRRVPGDVLFDALRWFICFVSVGSSARVRQAALRHERQS